MFDERRSSSFTRGAIGSLLVGALFGGVAFTSTKTPPVFPKPGGAATSTVKIAAAEVVTSTPDIFLGIPAPSAKADKLFMFNETENVLKEETVLPGWRLTALAASSPLKLQIKADGATWLMGADKWNVALRTRSGDPYQNVVLLGMFDATHAAVAASADGRVLLSASRFGEVRTVMTISEMMQPLAMSAGAVWLGTFQPGEGIESLPHGPSSLIRVGMDGSTSTIATDDRVITLAVAGPSESVAYGFDQGDMIARAATSSWTGQGRPLLWLDSDHLLFTQGVSLQRLTVSDGSLTFLVMLPAAPFAAAVVKPET